MSNPQIDEWYELGARATARIGGKLVGAGGGGFLLFYAEEKGKLRAALRNAGLKEVSSASTSRGRRSSSRSAPQARCATIVFSGSRDRALARAGG